MSRQMVLTGPTASGKGAVVFELARRLGASVASMDSMKVYREMDVVTAKPDAERRARCEYHLIDVVDPDVDFGDYRVAVGTGLRLKIPAFGQAPLAFDVAFPILKQDGDETRAFSFDIAVPF